MELNFDFFHITNDSVAEKGRILISEPFLSDQYFRRSIVYLTEHNEDGTLGFVLNKPLDIHINELVEDFPKTDLVVSVGGPVSNNTVHYLHTLGEKIPQSVHVADGIYWGGDFEIIKEMIAADAIKPSAMRFFLGYSGWSANQLDGEMEENAWLVGKIDPRMVMEAVESEFWSNTLARFNNKYRAWANFPEDPGLN